MEGNMTVTTQLPVYVSTKQEQNKFMEKSLSWSASSRKNSTICMEPVNYFHSHKWTLSWGQNSPGYTITPQNCNKRFNGIIQLKTPLK